VPQLKKLIVALAVAALYIIFAAPVTAAFPDGYEQAAETSGLILYLNRANGGFAVYDKKGGHIWKALADEDSFYKYDSATPITKSNMNSIFTFSYSDLSRKETNIRAVESNNANVTLDITDIAGGARLKYYFQDYGVTITVEIKIEGDELIARIPNDGVREDSKAGIVTVSFLPFFGSADRNTDGYLFYPDGCGAICRYDTYMTRPMNLESASFNIYGNWDEESSSTFENMWASFPVYGIKNGDCAILAAITEGDANSAIVVKPDGYMYELNRINFDFNYRTTYFVRMSNISVNGTDNARVPFAERVEKERRTTDREVRIFFLSGEDADYSGMAVRYREYLEANGKLARAISDGETAPMGVNIFMAAKEPGLIFDSLVKMTTYEQAADIVRDLLDGGVTDMQLGLSGWQAGGMDMWYKKPKPEWRLGGAKQLKKLTELAEANDIPVFLHATFLFGDAYKLNFSTTRDVVYTAANLPVSSFNNRFYLLNAGAALRFVKNAAKDIDYAGICVDDIGFFISNDYNKYNPVSSSDNILVWQEMIKAAKGNGYQVEVMGGNQYVLADSDCIGYVSYQSSMVNFTDEDVPFYQMIAHGSVPYRFQDGNYSPDLKKQVLKWIEYGAMPKFTITEQDPYLLRNTEYSEMFTSKYEDWSDIIKSIYHEYKERVGAIWSSKMTRHEQLQKDVFYVAYENGEVIYFNYNNEPVTVDGRMIPAMEYVVVERGGGVR